MVIKYNTFQFHQTAQNKRRLSILSHFEERTHTKTHLHNYHPLYCCPTFTSFYHLAPQITDSDGYLLYSRKNATKGRFSFTTENPVMFDVCFLSRSPMGE